MITIRPANERGIANFGWLDSRHSFSFGNYYDPNHMGFASLRVINEDKVLPGRGFGKHGHRDMEIISYVIDGALAHQDSLGNGSVILPGDLQRMSAGRGIMHSEFNDSQDNGLHFLQIWLLPEQQGIEPGYEQTHFTEAEKRGKLRLIGSRDGRDGSVTIHQDVNLYAGILSAGEATQYNLNSDRVAWLQVVRGSILLNDRTLVAGDGAAIAEVENLVIQGVAEDSEVLLFDMAVSS